MEGFNQPPEKPEEDKDITEAKLNEGDESIELTLDEKYIIAGRKDSILDQRGVHISISRLNELLTLIELKDKQDLGDVADTIERKHRETMGRGVNEAILNIDELVSRMNSIREYIYKYGLNDVAIDLIKEWLLTSDRTVTAEVTIDAQNVIQIRILLNLAEMYIAGNDLDTANKIIISAHKLAKESDEFDWIKRIENAFPELVTHF
jgi:hypothetical protein